MTISASLVKELREKSGAGMMDCKKALVEAAGDFEKAVDWLRTKGLAAAAKKSGRVAAEGLTAVSVSGNKAAAVEINSETDFVSRNSDFQNLVKEISEKAVEVDSFDSLKSTKVASGKTVEEEVVAKVSTIGENITLRRSQHLSVTDGVISSYVHNSTADNMGKISVLVALESTGDKAKLSETAKLIAMHVAAAKPEALTRDELDPALIQRERDIFTEQTKDSGKPANIIEKMIEGRIRKFYEEAVLLDQTYVIDGKTKINEVIANLSKEIGADVQLKSYVRFETGEGIEKEEANFADEVASMTKN
ncbi:MAG: hypothetical protein DGJ47_000149 [Rickettsiaceae bacterium]